MVIAPPSISDPCQVREAVTRGQVALVCATGLTGRRPSYINGGEADFYSLKVVNITPTATFQIF